MGLSSPSQLIGADGEKGELDKYEEKAIVRATERAIKANDTERHRWLRILDAAFPGKPSQGQSEEDLNQWYDLLCAGGKGWQRGTTESKPLADLYDRVVQKLELGPVPSIRREEFLQFARKAIYNEKDPPQKPADLSVEADRVFRVLDRDGSGVLERTEWTEDLRTAANKADKDGNVRIDAEEYRGYFASRVTTVIERGSQPPGQSAPAGPNKSAVRSKKFPPGTPTWFMDLDADTDGQVGLDEWRKGGRIVDEFLRMDLDGDGLLTAEEYQRFLVRAKQEPDPREIAEQPVKPDTQMGMGKRK